jgi:hypothetical protein
MDKQIIEILGRDRLLDELLRARLEVAFPCIDRGIDLIAYIDDPDLGSFIARPIQMKAARDSCFGLDKKYKKISGLIIAYVWFLSCSTKSKTYAMSYAEALSIAEIMGWTKTDSWLNKDSYVNTHPGKKLLNLLEPFEMDSKKWKQNFLSESGKRLAELGGTEKELVQASRRKTSLKKK